MYKVEGDGSYQRTKIWRDGKLISYTCLDFAVAPDMCIANVDGIEGKLDQILLTGIYIVIGRGNFNNTKVIFCDESLRGIQEMYGSIIRGQHPSLELKMVMLPNLVEEMPPIKVDERLVTFAEGKK